MPEVVRSSDGAAMVEPKPGAPARPHPAGPYVGPKPFGTEDADRFFGREREGHELAALVQAHPIVVLHSQSGAGKTSLLNARLVPLLESRGAVVHTGVRVGQRVDGLPADANIFTFNALTYLQDDRPAPHDTLEAFLNRTPASRPDGRPARLRVIVLDQFEEMFTLLPEYWQQRREFFRQIGRTLDTDDLRERAGRLRRLIAWCDRRVPRLEKRGHAPTRTRELRARLAERAAAVLKSIERADSLRYIIALREEFIAELDPFACNVPERLNARYRLERLRAPEARDAIVLPLAGTGVSYAPGAAELLVSNLRRGTAGTATGSPDISDEFIEPVHLQVVCENLWRNFGQTQGVITADDVRSCGNIDEALSCYFEQSIAQVAAPPEWDTAHLRSWFADELIRDNRRVLVMQSNQAVAGLSIALANQLAGLQLLRAVPRAGVTYFEITHDRFVRPIQSAHDAWREEMRRKSPCLGDWESRAAAWARSGRPPRGMLPPDALTQARHWLESDEARTLIPSAELREFVAAGATARATFEAAHPEVARAQARAAQWEREGRPDAPLFPRDELGRIEDWTTTPEAELVGYSPALKALESASRARLNELDERLPGLVRLEGRARQWVKLGRVESEFLTHDQLAEAEYLQKDPEVERIGLSAAARELTARSREARDAIEREHPNVRVWEKRAAEWRDAGRPPTGVPKVQDLEELTAWLAQPIAKGLGASRILEEWGRAGQARQEELRIRYPGAMFLTRRAADWDRKGRAITMLLPPSQVRAASLWVQGEDAQEMGVSSLTRDYVVASVTWARTGIGFGAFVVLAMIVVGWLGILRYQEKARALDSAQQTAAAIAKVEGMIKSVTEERVQRARTLSTEKGREYEALAAAILAAGDPILADNPPPDAVKILREAYAKVRGPTPLRDLGGEEPMSVHVSAQGLYALVVCPRGLYFFDCITGRSMGDPIRPSSPDSRWMDAHFTPDDAIVLATEAPRPGIAAERADPGYAANAPMVQRGPKRVERTLSAMIRLIAVPGVVPGKEGNVVSPFEPGVQSAADLGSTEDAKVCYAVFNARVQVWPDWPSQTSFELRRPGTEDITTEESFAIVTDDATQVLVSGKRDRIVTVSRSRGIELWSFQGERLARLTFESRTAADRPPTVLWSPAGDRVVGIQLDNDASHPNALVRVWDAAKGEPLTSFQTTEPSVRYVSLVNGGEGLIVVGENRAGANQAVTLSMTNGEPVSPPVTLGVTDLWGVRVLMDGRAIVFGDQVSAKGEKMAYAEVASTNGKPGFLLVAPKFPGACSDADTDSDLCHAMCIRENDQGALGRAFLWDRDNPAPEPDGLTRAQLLRAACHALDSQPERTQVAEILRSVLNLSAK